MSDSCSEKKKGRKLLDSLDFGIRITKEEFFLNSGVHAYLSDRMLFFVTDYVYIHIETDPITQFNQIACILFISNFGVQKKGESLLSFSA